MAATKSSGSAQPSNPFIKQLASSNRTTRDRALSSLRTFLSHKTKPSSQLELLKLWKGLFYCMFMSDKPRNQQQLARDLADLVDVLPSSTSRTSSDESDSDSADPRLDFLKAAWHTLGREWASIDYLRMDKYLYLARCLVRKGFAVLRETQWEASATQRYSDMLSAEGGPLSARDARVAIGLRLHVLDVWVDELENVDGEERVAPLEEVMMPVRRLGKESLVKSVRGRAKEALEDARLEDAKRWRTQEEGEDSEKEMEEDTEFKGFKD